MGYLKSRNGMISGLQRHLFVHLAKTRYTKTQVIAYTKGNQLIKTRSFKGAIPLSYMDHVCGQVAHILISDAMDGAIDLHIDNLSPQVFSQVQKHCLDCTALPLHLGYKTITAWFTNHRTELILLKGMKAQAEKPGRGRI